MSVRVGRGRRLVSIWMRRKGRLESIRMRRGGSIHLWRSKIRLGSNYVHLGIVKLGVRSHHILHVGGAWRDLDPSANVDVKVLLLGDRPLILGPDGIGVDDGVEGEPVGGAVPLPLGTVHPEVDAGDDVPLPSSSRVPHIECGVVVVNPLQK